MDVLICDRVNCASQKEYTHYAWWPNCLVYFPPFSINNRKWKCRSVRLPVRGFCFGCFRRLDWLVPAVINSHSTPAFIFFFPCYVINFTAFIMSGWPYIYFFFSFVILLHRELLLFMYMLLCSYLCSVSHFTVSVCYIVSLRSRSLFFIPLFHLRCHIFVGSIVPLRGKKWGFYSSFHSPFSYLCFSSYIVSSEGRSVVFTLHLILGLDIFVFLLRLAADFRVVSSKSSSCCRLGSFTVPAAVVLWWTCQWSARVCYSWQIMSC